MRWGAMVPLIGGQLVGTENIVGAPPEAIASFSPFKGSDAYATSRWNVPYHLVDEGGKLPSGLSLVVSVCPCAGLSMLSMAKPGSAARDEKNKWMFMSAEHVLGEARPDVYFGENAPGLFTNMGRDVAEKIEALGKKHGYGVSFLRMDAREHGNPQRRVRTFYFFWRGGTAPVMESLGPPAKVSAAEYLAGMPRSADRACDPPTYDLASDPSYQYLRQRFGDRWREGSEPERRHSNALKLMGAHQLLRDFVTWAEARGVGGHPYVRAAKRTADGEGCFTYPLSFDKLGTYPAVIKKTAISLVHPSEDRCLNVREAAWLMGLPVDYVLPPDRDYNIICQNVPRESAEYATRHAVAWLGGSLRDSGKPTTRFDSLDRRSEVAGGVFT